MGSRNQDKVKEMFTTGLNQFLLVTGGNYVRQVHEEPWMGSKTWTWYRWDRTEASSKCSHANGVLWAEAWQQCVLVGELVWKTDIYQSQYKPRVMNVLAEPLNFLTEKKYKHKRKKEKFS